MDELAPAELARVRASLDAARKTADADRQAIADAAREKAAHIWETSAPCNGPHPYLIAKGVRSHGLRISKWSALVVPVRDSAEVLMSLQFIAADGKKRYLAGGRKTGGHFVIGDLSNTDRVLVTEGYATGASVHEASGLPTVVAFDADNLKPVALTLRRRYPRAQLILCADDDAFTTGNPGRAKASEAARVVEGLLAIPKWGDDRQVGQTDMNDLHKASGIGAVLACIDAARAPVETEGVSDDVTVEKDADDRPTVTSTTAPLTPLIVRPVLITAAACARRLRSSGSRIQTGIPLIDRLTGGGLPTGTLTVVGGEPGAFKSTLVTQAARQAAERGVPVAFLAIDEVPDRVVLRFGQQLGFDQEEIERDSASQDDLASRLDAIPDLFVADGCTAAVDAVASELVLTCAGRPALLVVDSLQRARTEGTDAASDPRLRTNNVVEALRRAAAKGLTVIATSEVSRGAYGSNDQTRRTRAIASYKESGSIEFAADLAIVLQRVRPGTGDTVEVLVPKNRQGPAVDCAGFFRLDPRRATLSESDGPAVAKKVGMTRVPVDARALFEADKEAICVVLRGRPEGIRGKQNLLDLVPRGIGKNRKRAALEKLLQSGLIRSEGPPSRPVLFLDAEVCRSANSAPADPADPETRKVCQSAGLPPPYGGQRTRQTSAAEFRDLPEVQEVEVISLKACGGTR